MMKKIIGMLKKDHEFMWTTEAKESFQQIKETLGESPVLVSLNFLIRNFLFSLFP
jgi:hypothetical protein